MIIRNEYSVQDIAVATLYIFRCWMSKSRMQQMWMQAMRQEIRTVTGTYKVGKTSQLHYNRYGNTYLGKAI